MLRDLRFRDLRHEATSRLFERGLNPMQVAAITGHKTLQMLRRYIHLRAEDLVDLLGWGSSYHRLHALRSITPWPTPRSIDSSNRPVPSSSR